MRDGYNYDSFATDDYDFDSEFGPRVGDKVPDLTIQTVEGKAFQLRNFPGKLLVLELGSITCPLFQGRRPRMSQIESDFPEVSSAVLYVREAHPGDEIRGHATMADKQGCALRLRDEDGESRQILVDDLEGRAHKALGSMPNAVFIINRHGCVVYRSEWNNPSATHAAVAALLAGQAVAKRDFFRPAPPATVIRTLRRGGRGSFADFFRGLPLLIWTNLIKRNLRILFGRPAQGSLDRGC